jgi:hypothetical protein
VSWRRRVLGPPGRGPGAWRFPFTTLLALVVALLLALAGDWWSAAFALGIAVLMGAFTVAAARR